MHGDGLADDEAIADELADGLAGVGVGDFADLVGVEPDLALAAADDRGREALLRAEIDPGSRVEYVSRELNEINTKQIKAKNVVDRERLNVRWIWICTRATRRRDRERESGSRRRTSMVGLVVW